jgi:hypothetical protein
LHAPSSLTLVLLPTLATTALVVTPRRQTDRCIR